MEAATVARRSAAATAPAPARVPRDRPRPKGKPGSRPQPARKSGGSPARKTRARAAAAPARKTRARAAAPARKPRTRPSLPSRRTGAQLIPIAAGAATAVRRFPDSTLMVRMTRGRIWIGVLGVLLAGIVALNVFTLSLTAEAGHIDENVVALEKDNSILGSRDAKRSGSGRIRHDAGAIGLEMAAVDEVTSIDPSGADAAVAAQRLAGAY